MCVCVSTIAGITVLPVRFTRRAPAGTDTSAALPACTNRSPSTMKTAFSTAWEPSPTRSRAPSNTVTFVAAGAGAGLVDGPEQAADTNMPITAEPRSSVFIRCIGPPSEPYLNIALLLQRRMHIPRRQHARGRAEAEIVHVIGNRHPAVHRAG